MSKQKSEKAGGNRILKAIERTGNALPHPAIIFVILSAVVLVVSFIVSRIGTEVTFFDAREGVESTITATNLLSREGLVYIFNSATSNFTGFAPLGTVLVAMLGVGVAEWS